MGVPKFYRWISERYPKINQVITDSALLPEFDHLYLDMNGIIHGCTHPSHLDVSDILSERDMMLGIMHYIDRIVTQIVKPKVSLYMAIDGVAPRAKLNQQRSRRFRSAKDLKDATKKQSSHSLLGTNMETFSPTSTSNTPEAFDSNCITPGTEFMARVSNAIQYFIRKKIKEDPIWKQLKVIFSGHEVPGEGEHKIMQHIRQMKAQPGYQPNTRHCMYGQDADLIMLGLVSHEPHFTLLREIVDFGGGGGFQNKNALKTVQKFTKQSDFQLLHLSILREYLQIEFTPEHSHQTQEQQTQTQTKHHPPSPPHLESIIDDFVFMTFLIGNDFLPHLPSLDISENAFDLLFNTYKTQRLIWGEGQYLTNAGIVPNPARLEQFLVAIGEAETDIFEEREINVDVYLRKKRKWDKRDGKPAGPTDEELAELEAVKQKQYMDMMDQLTLTTTSKHRTIANPEPGKKDFKGRYYFEKLHFTPLDVESHSALRRAYVEGLLWCLAYYYKGCISWGWFYPYHYGPLLSDLTDLPEMFQNIKFQLGAPLKPFEQLMGCLPPASSKLVPKPYRDLMCNPNSPIKHFYPEEFQVDMNGKRNPWEGINLLPFIDIALLQKTITEHCPDKLLTLSERNRNSKGNVLCYTYNRACTESIPSFNRSLGLPNIDCCHSQVDILEEEANELEHTFKAELVPGTQIPYPGFPSLNVIPITYNELNGIGLNCFGSASKYSTRVLTLHKLPQLPGAAALANKVLGSSLFINWPMMHEAKVVAVSDSKCEIKWVKGKPPKIKSFTEKESEKWEAISSTIVQQYLAGNGVPGSGGVNIGDIQIRLKLKALQGMKTSTVDGSTKKIFGKEEAEVPLQMVLWKAPAPDPRFIERGPLKLQDRLPVNTNVLLTKGRYRGCLGQVLGMAGKDKIGVRVTTIPPEPPFGLAIARSVADAYISVVDAAKLLKMRVSVFARITGSVSFDPGRYDLGLNLTYKEEICVVGYTRKKMPDDPSGKKNNSSNKKKSAWSTGDSVLVVGSNRISQMNEKNTVRKKIIWEYTPRAIRLVAAYRQSFPQIFNWMNKYPNDRFYDGQKVFGAQHETMLKKIRQWLDNIETAKLPRSPSSTISMPLAAIAAVQRAADVRLVAQKESGSPTEVNVRMPSTAIFVEGSVSPTSVIQTMDYNDGTSPELGDRIANLCANGLVFGARGTVVAIHDAKTGCVEVVMDEEFIGGSTLQGACSNFRGKLCLWAHLLKISAADSKEVVETMILEKKNVHKVKNEENHEKEKELSTRSSDRDEKSTSLSSNVQVKLVTPTKTATSPLRSNPNSNSRGGKQGAWKEALGPNGNTIGFNKVRRSAKSGYRAWHKLVSAKVNGKKEKKKTFDSYSAGLKSILGVQEGNFDSVLRTDTSTTNDTAPTLDATEALKASLGLGTIASPSEPLPTNRMQTDVHSNIEDLNNIPLPPAQPTLSATKALEELMIKTTISPTIQPTVHQPPYSNFTFTYVEEGKTSIISKPMSHSSPNVMAPLPTMTLNNQGSTFPVVNNHQVSYPQLNSSSTIPRDKKGSNINRTEVGQSIIPSAVVTKLKK